MILIGSQEQQDKCFWNLNPSETFTVKFMYCIARRQTNLTKETFTKNNNNNKNNKKSSSKT